MKNISDKLNQYFKKYFINFDNTYDSEDANRYLSHNRIDVIAKIIYCEYFLNITPTNFNRLFYYLHLKKLNNFKATDSYKKSFFEYEKEFKKIILSIKERGFDEKKSLIPIDQYNKIIDGSHRLGASIVLNQKIKIAKFLVNSPAIGIKKFIYDFNFKKNITLMDYLIFNYIKYNKNLRIFTLFPVRNKHFDNKCFEIIKKYGNILITKSLPVGNLINGFNMCRDFYDGAKWIGNLNNKYQGAMWKAKVCLGNTNGIIDVIVFKPNEEKYSTAIHLKKMKEEIRELYKIRFHSIHSSDDHSETIRYSKIFFHSNTRILSQKHRGSFFNKLELSLEELRKLNVDLSQFVFSGSAVMAALGLREPKDLDVFHTKSFNLPNNISSHNYQIKYLRQKVNELIFNPKKYFFYMGFKFLHPKFILEMKVNRNKIKPNSKDQNDIKILEKFLAPIT